MRKYLVLIALTAFAGISLNCGNSLVPQSAFRVKTRGKLYLNGSSSAIPFSIPNSGIFIRLKTGTPSGTAGTTGTISEFDPSGYVSTDAGGNFDAPDAVMPATWSVRIAPGQSRCTNPEANPFSFTVSNGTTQKVDCKWYILRTFLVQPNAIAVGDGLHPPDFVSAKTLTGILVKSNNGSAIYRRFSNWDLKVQYYKQIDGEDYEFEGEKLTLGVSDNGDYVSIPVPDYTQNEGIVHYRILIQEIYGDSELYVGHGELDISYGRGRVVTESF